MKALMTFILAISFSSAFADELACHGTEPFWGAKITDTAVIVDDFESTSTQAIASRTGAVGMQPDFVFVVKTKNQSLSVVTGECNNGMSDEIFPYHVVFDRGDGTVFYGCCEKLK